MKNTLGLSEERMATWLVGFGSDGASVNMGRLKGIAFRLKTGVAPAITATHCYGHRGNLVAKAAEKVCFGLCCWVVMGL